MNDANTHEALAKALQEQLAEVIQCHTDENVDSKQGLIMICIDAAGNSTVTIAGQVHKQLAMGCCLEAATIVNDVMRERQMKQMFAESMAQIEKAVSGARDDN